MHCSAALSSMPMYVCMYVCMHCSAALLSMHMYVCIVMQPCVHAHVCMYYSVAYVPRYMYCSASLLSLHMYVL